MPTSVAVLLCTALVLALLVADTRRGASSPALWIPVLWMLVTGSRFVSQWLTIGPADAAAAMQEGNAIDAVYFAALIATGLAVLAARRVQVAALVRSNAWLAALFVYAFVSILWSDFPFTSFKRWIKALGHPVMVLVVLTDPKPDEALRIVMKRCAYVLLPYSAVLIKYVPELGRAFDPWQGFATNRGVGLTKNDLGYLCFIFGTYFAWNLLAARATADDRRRRRELGVSVAVLVLAAWLLVKANSATAVAVLAIACGTLLALRYVPIEKRHVGAYAVLLLLVMGTVELLFDPYAYLVRLLGRSPDLTDRTKVWADAIALQPNVVLGAGFEAFWLGDRLNTLWSRWWWQPNQAHNGYIETYLNLGAVGLALLVGTLAATFRKVTAQLRPEFGHADLRLAYLLAIVAFNYTEAAFKGVHLVWTIFFLVALDVAARQNAPLPAGEPSAPIAKPAGRRRPPRYLDHLATRKRRDAATPRRTNGPRRRD